jgi:hypothetical protein
MNSQNGWPVLESAPPAVTIPGTDVRITIRPGDVATVLSYLAARFHAEVEQLDRGQRDDWGWAYRPIRGQTSGFSNHASATAIDLNATRHPRGVRGTFTAAQQAAVRRILADLRDPANGRPVVRWGEDYTGTVDGMHFEINADARAVARVAAVVRANPANLLEDIMATPQQRQAFAREVAAAVWEAGRMDAMGNVAAAKTWRNVQPLATWVQEALGNVPPLEILQQAGANAFALRREVRELKSAIEQLGTSTLNDEERATLAKDVVQRLETLVPDTPDSIDVTDGAAQQ